MIYYSQNRTARSMYALIFLAFLSVFIFAAFSVPYELSAAGTGGGTASLPSLKTAYESEFNGYMKLLAADAGAGELELRAAALIEAKERYLAALEAEAERLEKDGGTENGEGAAIKNEMLKLQRSALPNSAALKLQTGRTASQDFSAEGRATAGRGASSKSAESRAARIGGGAKAPTAAKTTAAASSASAKTPAGKLSAFFKSVGSFFGGVKNAVAGFFSSAATFVKQTAANVFSPEYDENSFPSEIPASLAYHKFDGKDFCIGANFPWLPGGYGWDIGAHDSWGSRFNEKTVDETFARLAARKLTVVRWFLYCDGRANPKFDSAAGRFKHPDARFMADFDKIMKLAEKHGVKIVWSFLDFHWFKKDSANFAAYSKIASDPALQKDFIDKAVMPIVEKYASSPAIYAWEIINEPEWITSNVAAPGAPGTISVAELRALVANCAAAIRSASAKPITVGAAKPQWMRLYVGTGINMFQAHYYDKGSKIPKSAFSATEFKKKYKLDSSTPVILGEFASKGSRFTIGQYINMAKDAGYDGAWVWGYHSTDESTDKARIDAVMPGE